MMVMVSSSLYSWRCTSSAKYIEFYLQILSQFVKPPSDTLLCYFNMFHLAPSPLSLSIITIILRWYFVVSLSYFTQTQYILYLTSLCSPDNGIIGPNILNKIMKFFLERHLMNLVFLILFGYVPSERAKVYV
jgi:hypothetical protein